MHFIRIGHRDEVEAPITDWLEEAYEQSEPLSGQENAGTTPKVKVPESRNTSAVVRVRASRRRR